MTLLHTPLGPFETWPTGTITRALQAGQWWDDHLRPILDERPEGLALDLGAHIGWFTRYLAETHAQVIAVEPHPETFRLLEKNCVFYAPGLAHRIQRWPVAAYHHTCTLEQTTEAHEGGDRGAVSFVPDAPTTGGWTILGCALDDYLSTDAAVTVIKSDCQGADLPALVGLRDTIQRCRPLIIFEREDGLMPPHGHDWQDYLTFFDQLNYSVERITTDYWDFVARP